MSYAKSTVEWKSSRPY